ncbi:E3 ubiquitin-protein ligase RFI2-like [Zingiber officinale]|uniref:RING-type domain-containing protein n=1 Tax=Zingiber officinale TaxID=94328 RepID=A0A8J5ILE1_ZINOF|nr:E3 ubiquitin-protein ligase RFI2-like [Zingiber officinale]KAG6536123.1 hypothetical protein ZIOFF_001167 [Zingiber officinale]
MELEELVKEGKEGEEVVHDVACSICLEAVKSRGGRATARLQCGHEFHLDCIGSAFNAKGVMQCPNCRKVEEGGNWLYSNGCHPTPDLVVDEWMHNEDLHNHSYTEPSDGGHWCPFSGLARIQSLFEEGESSSAVAFRDLFGYHGIMTEHQATMSSTHPCPFIAHTQWLQPPPNHSTFDLQPDGLGYHQQWSYFSRPRDTHTRIAALNNLRNHAWGHHHHPYYPPNAHINSADLASHFSRSETDGFPSADSVFPPFVFSHRNGSRPGATSSSVPPMVPPHPRTLANFPEVYQRQNSQNVHGTNMPQPANWRGVNSGEQAWPFLISSTVSFNAGAIQNIGRHPWEPDDASTHLFSPVGREFIAGGPYPQPNGASDSNSPMNYLLLPNGPERLSVQAGYNQTIPPACMLSLM